jgi:hypothetical protein
LLIVLALLNSCGNGPLLKLPARPLNRRHRQLMDVGKTPEAAHRLSLLTQHNHIKTIDKRKFSSRIGKHFLTQALGSKFIFDNVIKN